MTMPNAVELDLLELLLQNTDLAGIGDAGGLRGSVAPGSIYVALFTSDPGETGTTTNECNYTGYSRVAVTRNGTEWVANGSNGLENNSAITFGEKTAGGDETATHFALCKAGVRATDDVIVSAALSASLLISNGVTPQFAAGALDTSAD